MDSLDVGIWGSKSEGTAKKVNTNGTFNIEMLKEN